MKARKRVTAAKIAANQANARESTGPTSERGKNTSRRNAIRHGILTRDLLLPEESGKELEELQNDMIQSYRPVGRGESLQVEIILASTWRLRRFHRAEAGEITKHLTDHEPAAQIAASTHTPQYQQAIADRTKLESIEEQIIREGRVSAENLDWLRALPYGEPVSLFVEMVEVIQAEENSEGESRSTEVSAAERPGGKQCQRRRKYRKREPNHRGSHQEKPRQSTAQRAIGSKEVRRLLLSGLDLLREAIEVVQSARQIHCLRGHRTMQCALSPPGSHAQSPHAL